MKNITIYDCFFSICGGNICTKYRREEDAMAAEIARLVQLLPRRLHPSLLLQCCCEPAPGGAEDEEKAVIWASPEIRARSESVSANSPNGMHTKESRSKVSSNGAKCKRERQTL